MLLGHNLDNSHMQRYSVIKLIDIIAPEHARGSNYGHPIRSPIHPWKMGVNSVFSI